MFAHTQHAKFIVFARPADVLHITLRRSLAQVDPTVIGLVSIDMINLSFRPNTEHPHEGKSMRQIAHIANTNVDVTECLVTTASNIATPRTSSRNQPSEGSGIWVVI